MNYSNVLSTLVYICLLKVQIFNYLIWQDSDGDGTGDLRGIIEKIDHLIDLGVSALWLSPIYQSPGVDQGYDISDYRDVDPLFGTLDDFKELLDIAHNKGKY